MIDEYSRETFFFFFFVLFLAIEYENIEMIELLLSYNVDTTEALLFAIDEQFVEGKDSSRCIINNLMIESHLSPLFLFYPWKLWNYFFSTRINNNINFNFYNNNPSRI